MNKVLMLLLGLLLVTACTPNTVFESADSMQAAGWDFEQQPITSVDIQDTTAAYDLYLVIRHTTNYPFSNLWITLHTTYPGGQTGSLRKQLLIGDNEAQQWRTDCLRNVCTGLLPILEGHRFTESGTYQFRLEHIMRTNPLPGIMDVGLRIEKRPAA